MTTARDDSGLRILTAFGLDPNQVMWFNIEFQAHGATAVNVKFLPDASLRNEIVDILAEYELKQRGQKTTPVTLG